MKWIKRSSPFSDVLLSRSPWNASVLRSVFVFGLAALFLVPLLTARARESAADAFQDGPSTQSTPNAAASIVKTRGYVSLEPVPRGRSFEVAVVADVVLGYHMNSNKPLDEFLIPTTLSAQLPPGLKQLEIIYPEGQLLKFSFSPDKPLSVYSGRATLRMRLEAAADAPLGAQTIPLTLRYQACNDTTCLPPVSVPVAVKVQISSAGARARPLHPEIFAAHNPPSAKSCYRPDLL